jgi:hypothetical protein
MQRRTSEFIVKIWNLPVLSATGVFHHIFGTKGQRDLEARGNYVKQLGVC